MNPTPPSDHALSLVFFSQEHPTPLSPHPPVFEEKLALR